MKEAAGEANMTVVTIILIAIVLAIGGVLITNMVNNVKDKGENATKSDATNCSAGTYWNGVECTKAGNN